MQNRRRFGGWGGKKSEGGKRKKDLLKAGWCGPFLGRDGVRKETEVGKTWSEGREAEIRGLERLQLQTDNVQLCPYPDFILNSPYCTRTKKHTNTHSKTQQPQGCKIQDIRLMEQKGWTLISDTSSRKPQKPAMLHWNLLCSSPGTTKCILLPAPVSPGIRPVPTSQQRSTHPRSPRQTLEQPSCISTFLSSTVCSQKRSRMSQGRSQGAAMVKLTMPNTTAT